IALFYLLGYGVILINQPEFNMQGILIVAGAVGLTLFQYGVLTAFFPGIDRAVLLIANFLCAVGLVVLYRINPDTALKQLIWMAIGMVGMVIALVLVRYGRVWPQLTWLYILASFGLLAITLVFGRSSYGANLSFSIAGFAFQPSEFVKVVLVMGMAAMLYHYRGLPTILLMGVYVGTCLILLLLSKDLGAALLYAGTAICMLYAGTSSKLLTGTALGVVAGGSVAAYYLFSHVRVRVALWKNPWAMYEGQGYQVVQGLIAIASGGLFGLGLTNGMPMSIPVRQSDYIFAVICEEFGWIIGICLVALYLVFIVRGAIIAMGARNSFDAVLAIGCVSMITLQSFINIGGVIKLIPLTGITLPFVSYGGSSMITCFVILGVLEGIAVKNADADALEFEENRYVDDEYEYEEEYVEPYENAYLEEEVSRQRPRDTQTYEAPRRSRRTGRRNP
ncbi:FtsW/RodA/SpoVE family cell cycle protein, partial [Eubacteriales bacterium OttesenSCG-928-M02]|nr:FtsW/RodA/SpoVE family cell cycle protein [Eubacteriales bacterium OttesenSCG-928-M02]